MNLVNQLQIKLAEIVLAEFSHKIEPEKIILERPADESHGDWATNIAMVLSGQLKQNPREIAQKIVQNISHEQLEKTEIAGPGFINFKLKPEYFLTYLSEIDQNLDLSVPESEKMRIVAEMGDPNTHKLPHIGHLFNYITGDSFARMLIAQGHEVKKVSWQGDIGPHVAKCMYGWYDKGKPDPKDLIGRMRTLQDCYVHGSTLNEESEEHKQKIKELNKKIYLQDLEVFEDWKMTKKWSLDFDEYFEEKLGIKLDYRYLEGDQWERGLNIVKEHIGEVFEESQGAIVFPGEKYGLHTRVFITREGTATYEAKEIGLNTQKMLDFPYDLTVIPTASEQNAYFKVVIMAIEKAVPELKGKMKHIGTGMISLTTGKMSSRTGNILNGPDLVSAVQERVEALIEERDFSGEEKANAVNKVTMAAIKYAFLKSNILQNMKFDLEESISFNGNSGPYLLYTYARIQSVLRKNPEVGIRSEDLLVLSSTPELTVIKWLARYPETVRSASKSYAPHQISNYIFELAQRFNSFYKDNSINSAESPELIVARRELASAVAETLKSGLKLLGIETVERM